MKECVLRVSGGFRGLEAEWGRGTFLESSTPLPLRVPRWYYLRYPFSADEPLSFFKGTFGAKTNSEGEGGTHAKTSYFLSQNFLGRRQRWQISVSLMCWETSESHFDRPKNSIFLITFPIFFIRSRSIGKWLTNLDCS